MNDIFLMILNYCTVLSLENDYGRLLLDQTIMVVIIKVKSTAMYFMRMSCYVEKVWYYCDI